MLQMINRLKGGVSGLTLLAFALPFLTISCGGAEMTLSGLDLSFGRSLEGSAAMGSAGGANAIGGQPAAFAALVCAAIALLASLPSSRSAILRLARLASSLAGAILLLLLRFGATSDIPDQMRAMITVSYASGYWIALLGFATSFLMARAELPNASPAVVGEFSPSDRQQPLDDRTMTIPPSANAST
jgi:hypothetical protein